MFAHKVATATVAAIATAAVSAAVLGLSTAPSDAQAPPVTTAKRKPGEPVAANRQATKVTVRKRSFLDPGTETKAGGEHYQDYAIMPGQNGFNNSTMFNSGPGLPFINNRMPFPNCYDLPGFCR